MYRLILNGKIVAESTTPFTPVKNGWKNTGEEIQGGHLAMIQVFEQGDPENQVEPGAFSARHPDYKFPVLTVIKFKMCFTSAERVAVMALRETDPMINDFFSIIDDLRCTDVDLNLETARAGVNYLIGKVDGFTEERAAQVLSGTLI